MDRAVGKQKVLNMGKIGVFMILHVVVADGTLYIKTDSLPKLIPLPCASFSSHRINRSCFQAHLIISFVIGMVLAYRRTVCQPRKRESKLFGNSISR